MINEERSIFKHKLKQYCKLNFISQRSIARKIGISDQEFHNMLVGFQNEVSHASLNWERFTFEVLKVLNVKEL